MLAQSTRPKCKADTHYLPTPDGVYLRGNSSRLVLKGKSLYPLLSHLMPTLNGDLTLEELTADLDAERKRMVTHLIEKLFAHQFLRDVSQDQLHELDPASLETYAPDLAFIESFQTSPASRFDGFRQQRLLLLGSGPGLVALVQTGRQAGIRQVDVLLTRADAETAQEVLTGFARDADESSTRILDGLRWEDEDEVRRMLQAYDAILHIVEPSMLERARLLHRLCRVQQKVCMQAVVVAQRAYIGPLVSPTSENCWECAWRRLRANLDLPGAGQACASEAAGLTAAGAEMLACHLLFGLFHYFTQTSAVETASTVRVLDLNTYASENHTFLPHPQCEAHEHEDTSTASHFLARVARLRQQTPSTIEHTLEKLSTCIDAETGFLTALDTGNFVQVPLAIYQVSLARGEQNADDLLPALEHQPCAVIAAGVETRSTLLRCAQQACERYALNMVDQRRLLTREDARQFPHALQVNELVGEASAIQAQERWTWALDLRTQEAALVPANYAFAGLTEQARGVGSGQTWEEALCQGLLDWCQALTMARVAEAKQAYPQLDLATLSMTPEGEYLYRQLNTSGRAVTAYDLTDVLGVPTCAFCLDGKTIAYAAHCEPAQAVRLGLEQTLQQCQSELFRQPEYALAPVVDLPVHLRGEQWSPWSTRWPQGWPECLARLQEVLAQRGLNAYVVPLDHDPALADMVPFITRVLLRQSGMEKGE